MNLSKIVNAIKLSLGLQTIALPFDKPVDLVVQEILKITVDEFSEFKPYEREGFAIRDTLRSPSEIDKQRGIYILPESLTQTEVRSADAYLSTSQYRPDQASISSFTVGTPFVGFGSYYPQDILNATMTGAAVNKFAGVTSQTPTSKWLGFNKIQLFNFPEKCYIRFVVKCNHPSVETIPDTCYTSFIELAELDVKRTLYDTLKNMNNTGGAYKETMLKIDEWSGAAQAQKDLINQMKGVFHLDDIELIQFF